MGREIEPRQDKIGDRTGQGKTRLGKARQDKTKTKTRQDKTLAEKETERTFCAERGEGFASLLGGYLPRARDPAPHG